MEIKLMELNQAEFLPAGIMFVNKYRLQHGDVSLAYGDRGQLAEAKAIEQTVLEYLYMHKRIESEHYRAAQTFRAWQDAYRAKWGNYVLMRYGQEKSQGSEGYEDRRYVTIIRQLTKEDVDVLEMLFGNKAQLVRYNLVLEKLVKLMLEIEKELV